MSKVIRNIATQRPIWTSQPQGAVCVIPEFSQGIVFLPSIRANCVNGKKPVASGTGLFSEVNVGGEVAGLDGTGTGRYDFTITDSPFYTVVWYGSILGSGTSTIGRIFSTLNGSGGHELYCSGGNLLFDTWFSAGSGQGTFPVSFSEKPICIVATYDASNGTNRPDVWVEGKKITLSGGTSSGSRLAGGTTLAFGGRASSTDRQGYQKILLAGYVARKISGDLAQSLSANPWQIFQPLARQAPFDLVRGPTEPRQSYMMGTTAPEVSTAMPAAILKTGWTSQPPKETPVDRSHPLLKNCIFFYAAGNAKESIGGKPRTKGSAYAEVGNSRGLGLTTLANGGVSFPAIPDTICNETTFFAYVYVPALKNTTGSEPFVRTGGQTALSITGYTGGMQVAFQQYMYPQYVGVHSTYAGSLLKAGQFYLLVGTFRRNSFIRIYANGSLVSESVATDYAMSLNPTADLVRIGSGEARSMSILFSGISTREFSKAEVQQFASNPNQIFAPQSKQIWVAP